MRKAVFLYDYTGIMAKPWADAGYVCFCFDGQHKPGVNKSDHENILNVGMWFDAYTTKNHVEEIKMIVGEADFVFGFPECTDLTVAGARHFSAKAGKNPAFMAEACELARLVMYVGDVLNCKWGFENPVGMLSTLFRKYDFKFNPCDYAGYLKEGDDHPIYPEIYPGRDLYNKGTCIWSGNGFIEPEKRRIDPEYKSNPGWLKCGGKSLKTKNIRSATPRGFAQAVFEANSKK